MLRNPTFIHSFLFFYTTIRYFDVWSLMNLFATSPWQGMQIFCCLYKYIFLPPPLSFPPPPFLSLDRDSEKEGRFSTLCTVQFPVPTRQMAGFILSFLSIHLSVYLYIRNLTMVSCSPIFSYSTMNALCFQLPIFCRYQFLHKKGKGLNQDPNKNKHQLQ